MSRIDDLVAELCPAGVERRAVSDCVVRPQGIRWSERHGEQFQYIDLTSVDRVMHKILDTATITSEKAPSRAQQIVRTGDVIFGTTRPTLGRYVVIPPEYDGQICSTGFCVLRPDIRVLLTNYLFHLLGTEDFREYVERNERGASYPAISDTVVKRYRIPVPPLEVQRKIVTVLDAFTELEAELEAELAARQQQYAHYRRVILDQVHADGVPISSLGTWQSGITPSKADPAYWASGTIPWLASMDVSSARTDDIRGRVTERALSETSLRLVPAPSVAVVMRSNILRRTLPIGLIKVDTTVNQDMRALVPRQNVDAEYVFQALRADSERIRSICVRTDGSMAAVDPQGFFGWEIPLPSLAEQRRIAETLRHFDALVNDLSAGLPAELSARRKQYEHYRDRLLTFPEAA